MKLLYEIVKKDYGSTWHPEYEGTVIIKDFKTGAKVNYFNIAPIFSGCGALNFHNFIAASNYANYKFQNYSKEDWLKLFNKIFEDLKSNGVGAIYFTIGQDWSDKGSNLIELGFEEITSYNNYRHGSSYIQKLFIKKL